MMALALDQTLLKVKNIKKCYQSYMNIFLKTQLLEWLLTQDEEFTVVLSAEKAILQHDIFSWVVHKDKLVKVPNTTKGK